MRLFVVVLVMAITASTQAMAFGPRHQRDTRKAEVNEGCSAEFYRGRVASIHNPDYPKPYRPDPYWTPCDYSLARNIPRAVVAIRRAA